MSKQNLWVEENYQDIYAMRFKVERTLFHEDSEFQSVDVVETAGHGKMLLNDGLVMVTERDEAIYHDMLAHVPMFTHPNPKRVLIIGGGDGGTAREVLRHPGIAECVMVEIDEAVVRACQEHIPQTAKAIGNDPRLNLLIEDGVKYVKENAVSRPGSFDLILVDSTDPIGPAAPLFGPEFYGDVHRLLAPDGIVVSQAESPFYFLETQNAMLKVLRDQFSKVYLYNFTNMSYPGGFWSFSMALKQPDLNPLVGFQKQRYQEFLKSGGEFFFYNSGIHQGAFCLPSFQLKKHEGLIANSI